MSGHLARPSVRPSIRYWAVMCKLGLISLNLSYRYPRDERSITKLARPYTINYHIRKLDEEYTHNQLATLVLAIEYRNVLAHTMAFVSSWKMLNKCKLHGIQPYNILPKKVAM